MRQTFLLLLLGAAVSLAACGPRFVAPSQSPPIHQPPAVAPPLSVGGPAAQPTLPPAASSANPVSNPATIPRVSADSVLNLPGTPPTAVYHEVVRGENLTSIGRRYGFSAEQLQKANGLESNPTLQPGQLIYIPPK